MLLAICNTEILTATIAVVLQIKHLKLIKYKCKELLYDSLRF